MRTNLALLVLALSVVSAGAALATPGDTTWVATFDQQYINWATPHYATFNLPADPSAYDKVLAFVTIECPTAPDDCDPWDRLGHLRVVTADQGDVEIARFITPYDITGGSYPGSCVWNTNVTRYKSLLQDSVELRLYVESWIGGTNGWLVSIDFAFIEGVQDPEPYRVVNLWNNDWVEYGNPADPFSDHVQPMTVDIPSDVTKVNVSMFVTGHGQGNTDNAAEFSQKNHSLFADGTEISHLLWRSNCWANTCSPQGGTWSSSRAGWCPGDEARAWTTDVTSAITPGTTATLDYQVEAYENLCRPGNPSCVNGVTCTDCNYNSTGHTTPHYTVQGQAIFWKPRAEVVGADVAAAAAGDGFALGQNAPNPFRPATTFEYTVPRPGPVAITVYDAAGRRVIEVRREHATAGTFRFDWDGRTVDGRPVAAGAYFYSVRADGRTLTRKMIRLN